MVNPLSSLRLNNRKVTKGRKLQKIQLIERDENYKPILDKNGKHILIPNKFKFIKHKIVN